MFMYLPTSWLTSEFKRLSPSEAGNTLTSLTRLKINQNLGCWCLLAIKCLFKLSRHLLIKVVLVERHLKDIHLTAAPDYRIYLAPESHIETSEHPTKK